MLKFMNLQSFRMKALKWLEHPFTKDVAVLQISTVLAKIIGIVTALIFARVLGPEQYGFYGLVFALGGTINIFQDFGIGQAAINLLSRARSTDDREEAKQVLKFFGLISVLTLFTTGLVGFLLAPYLGQHFYHNRYLGQLAAIVVAVTALTFFYPLATIILQVTRRMTGLAILESVNKFLLSLIPLGLVILGLKVFGIVFGQLVVTVLISIAAIIVYHRLATADNFVPRIFDFFRQHLSWQKFKSYFRFSIEIAIGKNLVKFLATIPILFTGYFMASDSSIGFYKIAFAYVSVPLLILDPVTRLLDVQLSFTQQAGKWKLRRRFLQVSLISLAVMLAITIPMILLGPWLIKFFFPQYTPSIRLVYGLAIYPALLAAGVGIAPLFRTINRVRTLVYIQIANFLITVPAAYFLIRYYHIKGLIFTTLLSAFTPNFIAFVYFLFYHSPQSNGKEI